LRLAKILGGDGQGNKKTSAQEQGHGRIAAHRRNLILGYYALSIA
jgi:hypothetical protein